MHKKHTEKDCLRKTHGRAKGVWVDVGKLCAFEYFTNIIKRREKWNIILCYWIWNYVCDMLGSFFFESFFLRMIVLHKTEGGDEMEADGFRGGNEYEKG